MLSILIAIRDLLLAVALAWVGLNLEPRVSNDAPCAGETCQAEAASD